MTDYANNVLIEPEWLEQHLHDDSVRVVEVDENPALYRVRTSLARSDSTGAKIYRTS
jgi:3-mercaptopyruvate sulfurtransferase SseA